METLGSIGSHAAQAAIRTILTTPDLPSSLLPLTLQAALTVKLKLSQRQISSWLEHEAPIVRARAFTLIQASNPERALLETGFADPDPMVRRSALITAGKLGQSIAKAGLLDALRRKPTADILQALIGIADDDIIVIVGRFALDNAAYQPLIADEFEGLDNLKAQNIVRTIRAQT